MAILLTVTREETHWTAEKYLARPDDGQRYEVIQGDLLMAPAPNVRHQEVTGNIYAILRAFVSANQLGRVFPSPVDVVLGEDLVEPDVVFVSNERAGIVGRERINGAPDLVVEVLSLSTSVRDLRVKWEIYARSGVSEYWVVNPESETVEVLTLVEGAYRTHGLAQGESPVTSKVLEDLSAPLKDVFA